MSQRTELLNAFRPAGEQLDPAGFAGRRKQVRALTDALHVPGSCPVIYGERGLGKSSLALQLVRIASGDLELLEHLGFADDGFSSDEHYVPFYFTCDDDIRSTRSLLARLVAEVEAGRAGLPEGGMELSGTTSRFRVGFKFMESESVKSYTTRARASRKYKQLDPQDQILRLCGWITEITGKPVLLVVDELDLVSNTSGLASFIKSASSEVLKFMLVGIAQDLSKLLDGHLSLTRMALPVEVPRMAAEEQEEIVANACSLLAFAGIDVTFTVDARRRIVSMSNGFPWLTHVLGQETLIQAFESYDGGANVAPQWVEEHHVQAALDALPFNRFLQEFGDLYQAAVRDSPHREYLLKALATWPDRDVPTQDVYRIVRDLGVPNPSPFLGQLQQSKYGRVIERPPYQQRGLVRFRNALFKNYARIRPSLFRGIGNEVEGAFDGY